MWSGEKLDKEVILRNSVAFTSSMVSEDFYFKRHFYVK